MLNAKKTKKLLDDGRTGKLHQNAFNYDLHIFVVWSLSN